MKLHLTITKDFNYLNYISAMSAIKNYDVVFWILEEPDNGWWSIVKKVSDEKNLVPTTKEKGITLSYRQGDRTGTLDIIWLGGELTDDYVTQANMVHGLFEHKDVGEFEAKDIPLVRVHPTEDFSLEQIDAEWVRTSDTLLAELIKTVLLERVWDVKI